MHLRKHIRELLTVKHKIPESVVSQGLLAGLDWSEILELFLRYGLPALQALIESLLKPKAK